MRQTWRHAGDMLWMKYSVEDMHLMRDEISRTIRIALSHRVVRVV